MEEEEEVGEKKSRFDTNIREEYFGLFTYTTGAV